MADFIQINTQYRDAGNYKNPCETVFKNDLRLSVDQINEVIESTVQFENPLMAEDHYLENNAPVDNEFVDPITDYDHAFIEICDVEELEAYNYQGEIPALSLFIDSLKNPEKHSNKLERKERVRVNLLGLLDRLD